MARNAVQFQKGMSLGDFMARYGTVQQCEGALERWRWPGGFLCPGCGHGQAHRLRTRHLRQCAACRAQTSRTSQTLFAGTKLPLTVWFLAIYLLSQAKHGIASLERARSLGVSANTAWLVRHKLMQAMLERDARRPLSGAVQLDDAYWGGRRRGYKRGRGSRGKSPLVAAVELDPDGHPRRMRFSRVRGFRRRELARWSQRHLVAGTHVVSDGLRCFAGVTAAGCTHQPVIMNRPDQQRRRRALQCLDTVLGNVKNALHGTHHAIAHKHLPRYLAEFSYRFNRRFDLSSLPARLAFAAAHTPPMPYRLIKLAEPHW